MNSVVSSIIFDKDENHYNKLCSEVLNYLLSIAWKKEMCILIQVWKGCGHKKLAASLIKIMKHLQNIYSVQVDICYIENYSYIVH